MRAEQYPKSEGVHGPIWKIARRIRVSRTADKTYELEVPERGKRKRRRVESLEMAIAAAELFALRSGLELNLIQPQENYQILHTFEDAAKDWFSIHEANWSPSTLERYRGLLDKHILPRIGTYPINAPLDQWRDRVKRLLVDMRSIGQSPKSIEVAHSVVHGIFGEAEDTGRIKGNPAAGILKRILPPKRKRNLTKPDPFAKAELDRF